jgi:hypothetical protein
MRFGRAAIALTLLAPGCSSFLTDSTTSSYVVIDSLLASTGREPDKLAGVLNSDVLTYVKRDQIFVPQVFADNLVANFSLGLKNPGSGESPLKPTTTNLITITRYHVKFVRSDGRNVEGVDVPYAFDGGVTVPVTPDGVKATMTLVRIQSKQEAPLRALISENGQPAVGLNPSTYAISTIAEVTFYGKDQTGRDVSVTGKISVNFADWGDPQ